MVGPFVNRVVVVVGLAGALLVGAGWTAGCGTIGPPVAPEDIGVTAKLLKEKEKERAAKAKEVAGEAVRAAEAQEEVVLPPIRPVGAR